MILTRFLKYVYLLKLTLMVMVAKDTHKKMYSGCVE